MGSILLLITYKTCVVVEEYVSIPYGLVVRIPAFHAGGPGSIPGVGGVFLRFVRERRKPIRAGRTEGGASGLGVIDATLYKKSEAWCLLPKLWRGLVA